MTVSWKSWPNLFHVGLLLCTTGGGVSQKFEVEPTNSTVLQGNDAHFRATVHIEWDVMIWFLNNTWVLTFSNKTGVLPSSSKDVSASFCPGGDTSCVEFIVHNVSHKQSGSVTCAIQGVAETMTAELHVEVNGTVSIMGGDVTTEEDQQVEFHCVTTAWLPSPTVIWRRNGQAVDSSLSNTTSVKDGDLFNSTSVLKFQAVSNTTVECQATVSALPNPQFSSVFLVVVPKPPDWTVLIAVVVSFGGLALLVLLIIGIIFCCKRRKEKKPNYQDEMKKVRTESQISSVSGQINGQVNTGYVPDDQTSVTRSDRSDSGFSQLYDVVNSDQAGIGYIRVYNNLKDSGLKTHRHATIV